MSEQKRNSISIKSKYEILMKLKSGTKRDLIISEYKLKSHSHLTEILKNERKIIEKYESVSDKTSGKSFLVKNAQHPEVEEALLIWMRQMRAKRVAISGDLLLQQAKKFGQLF